MPETLYLKPADGLTVIDPATGKALPAEGMPVESSLYWMRRLREGDVTELQTQLEAPAKTPTKK